MRVALLTGGGDKPYALKKAGCTDFTRQPLEFIGSDKLSVKELLTNWQISFLNLRGDQRPEVNLLAKVLRGLRLLCEASYCTGDTHKTKALSYLVE